MRTGIAFRQCIEILGWNFSKSKNILKNIYLKKNISKNIILKYFKKSFKKSFAKYSDWNKNKGGGSEPEQKKKK